MNTRIACLCSLLGAALFSLSSEGAVVNPKHSDARCLEMPDTGVSVLDRAVWHEWFGDSLRWASGNEHLSFIGGELRQRFVPADNGTDRVTAAIDIAPHKVYQITQRITLEPGWSWGIRHQGGKMGFSVAGGSTPTGGEIKPDGFTARIGFRGNNDGTGRLMLYSYAADRNTDIGVDYVIYPGTITPGIPLDVTTEVGVNSAAHLSDGWVKVWYSEKLVLSRKGIQWQSKGEPIIDVLMYSTFFGGNTAEWAPEHTSYARISRVCWKPVL